MRSLALVAVALASVDAVAECAHGLPVSTYEFEASSCAVPQDVALRNAYSVVGVEFVNYRGVPDNCNGVLLHDGYVLTAAHCTPTPSHTQVVTIERNGARVTGTPPGSATSFAGFLSEDLAIVDVGVAGRAVLLAAGASEARIGALDLLQNKSELLVHSGAIVVPIRIDTLKPLTFEYAADTYPGWSGSPIFSATGRVVGVHARVGDSNRYGFKTGVRVQAYVLDQQPDRDRRFLAEVAEPVVERAVQDSQDERFVNLTVRWPVSPGGATTRSITALSGSFAVAALGGQTGNPAVHQVDIPIGLGDGQERSYTAQIADPFPSSRRAGVAYPSSADLGVFAVAYPVIEQFWLDQANGNYAIRASDLTPQTRPRTNFDRRIELCVGTDCDWTHPLPYCNPGAPTTPCSPYTGGDALLSWNSAPNSQQRCNAIVGACFEVDIARHPGAALPLKWFQGFQIVTLRVRDMNSSVAVTNSYYFFNSMPSHGPLTHSCFCQWGVCSLSVQGESVYDWNEHWTTSPVLAELAVEPLAGSTPIQARFSYANGLLAFDTVQFPQQCSGLSCWWGGERVTWKLFLNETGRFLYNGHYDVNFRKELAPVTTICNGVF